MRAGNEGVGRYNVLLVLMEGKGRKGRGGGEEVLVTSRDGNGILFSENLREEDC